MARWTGTFRGWIRLHDSSCCRGLQSGMIAFRRGRDAVLFQYWQTSGREEISVRFGTLFILNAILLTVSGLFAQSSAPMSWKLPQHLTVKDNGPRTYRFKVDYYVANSTGEIVQR